MPRPRPPFRWPSCSAPTPNRPGCSGSLGQTACAGKQIKKTSKENPMTTAQGASAPAAGDRGRARHHPPQPAQASEPAAGRRPRRAAKTVRPDRGRSRGPGAGADRHRPRLFRRLRSQFGRRTRDQRRRAAERGLRLRGGGQPAGRSFGADDLPAQWRRLWRRDRSGAGLRFPHRRRQRRDVHAGGAARPALLQERDRALRVAARRRQRQESCF